MTAIKSFKQMRLDGDTKRGESIQALLEDIHEEPGFNVRIKDAEFQQSVEELAEFMANGGVVPPLEVRPRPGSGVWLVDGHRRRSAYALLDSQGRLPRTPRKSDPSVLEAWIDVKPFVGNDAERVLRLATSNANKPLSAVELCNVYTQLLAFKWTPEQIAKKLGKPVSHVKMILDLAGGNTDVHELVQAKAVSPTIAAETVRKHGDAAGSVLKDQLATAQAAGKSKVTAATTKPKVERTHAVRVEDRMPELHTRVLVWVGAAWVVSSLHWDEPGLEDNYSRFQYWAGEDSEDLEWESVTHWHPLPAVPVDTP